jgi:hypothetical protein
LKQLAIFFLIFYILVSCDRELKEHPISPQVKQQLADVKPDDPAETISGIIEFKKSLALKVPVRGTLFIIARPEGITSGPPIAAKKHSLIKFPFKFKIGQQNVMLDGNEFQGKMKITARWDLDGLPKAAPDDIEGSITVPSGSTNVKLILDHVIELKQAVVQTKTISGTIRIDPTLADQIPKGASLFLIARSEGSQRGMPLAVKKIEEIKLPYSFSLGQSDVMLPGAVFDGPMTIFARLDKDGDAAANSGDIDGSVTASAGDKQLKIILNHLIGS